MLMNLLSAAAGTNWYALLPEDAATGSVLVQNAAGRLPATPPLAMAALRPVGAKVVGLIVTCSSTHHTRVWCHHMRLQILQLYSHAAKCFMVAPSCKCAFENAAAHSNVQVAINPTTSATAGLALQP
jgi:hypothetical protein